LITPQRVRGTRWWDVGAAGLPCHRRPLGRVSESAPGSLRFHSFWDTMSRHFWDT
jgi:hypothetical protein